MNASVTSPTLQLFSKEQLSKHNNEKDCWVSVWNRKIYDVTPFLEEHPGGADYILEHAGRDITQVLKDRDIHEHSETAYEILRDNYHVGYLATEEEEKKLLTNDAHKVEVHMTNSETVFDSTTFVKDLPTEDKLSIATNYSNDYNKHKFLDLNRPLVPQVMFGNFSKDFYLDQVHRPRHYGKGSAPLFGNFLEPLSKTPWWLIPCVWLPIVSYHIYVGYTHMNKLFSVILFGVGIFVWTLIEYGLHRFLFHLDEWLPNNNAALTMHFLLHGVHHYLPMDRFRLVMPPTLGFILCAPFYKTVFALLPRYWAYSGFAGGLFGYICYDLTHYFLHHVKLPSFMRKLKKYHLEHHYKNYQLGFGVTSWYWDTVFGTYLGPDAPLSHMKYD
ncbi:ZYBA0S04-07184g1_1 [Zygosaccharomyces bailii CLIB 213]|uniref:Ceramide very long chain fatty acid hydroxylase n=1 Tax=Zygosaccharomyces bailii (strain CLIB 213 / ATCC 58445 / CBS 680 / BCRC 21525 / NBRC 1098 / NCYC 1416 / NRRL Y-2227) TaxID=1333698 RepID=A0A8J2T763_ZYGB2|nr:ZYBA0S04-07184g1_1 [Zygosaccharomyces bailii CLIB 213]